MIAKALFGFSIGVALTSSAQAEVIFSYDASTGQMPTEQGWSAYNVQTGSTVGTNANAGMIMLNGESVLHIKDYTNATGFRLPLFHHAYTDATNANRESDLLNDGIRITMVFQANTETANNGIISVGMGGTAFEDADNIASNRHLFWYNLAQAGIGEFHTLVMTGKLDANNNFSISHSIDGNPGPGSIQNSAQIAVGGVFSFGAGSTSGVQTDLYIKSVAVEVLPIPEPASLGLLGIAASVAQRRRRPQSHVR